MTGVIPCLQAKRPLNCSGVISLVTFLYTVSLQRVSCILFLRAILSTSRTVFVELSSMLCVVFHCVSFLQCNLVQFHFPKQSFLILCLSDTCAPITSLKIIKSITHHLSLLDLSSVCTVSINFSKPCFLLLFVPSSICLKLSSSLHAV